MFDKVKFLWKWNKFGLGLRRLFNMLRDMGNKKGGRTWWGAVLFGVGGILVVVSLTVGTLIPAPYGLLIPGVVMVLGIVAGMLGLGRKWGEMLNQLGWKGPHPPAGDA